MIFIAIIWQKYIYLLKLIFYLTKANIMTECITLFPCLINHKNWFIAYLPILSLFRIFLETNFNIWNWKATAYFTFDTNVAIQNAEEKDEVKYTDVIIKQNLRNKIWFGILRFDISKNWALIFRYLFIEITL